MAAWLKSRDPLWHTVGRVTFHLAENKRDEQRPFAFLATYTHRLSQGGKPQHLPLARALQEYAGAKNQTALSHLLAPVQTRRREEPPRAGTLRLAPAFPAARVDAANRRTAS